MSQPGSDNECVGGAHRDQLAKSASLEPFRDIMASDRIAVEPLQTARAHRRLALFVEAVLWFLLAERLQVSTAPRKRQERLEFGMENQSKIFSHLPLECRDYYGTTASAEAIKISSQSATFNGGHFYLTIARFWCRTLY